MNRRRSRWIETSRPAGGLLIAALVALLPMGLAGCGGDEEEKQEVAVAPPPPPPPPRPKCALGDLREELQVSSKVRLSEAEAPPNCDDRRNLLVFFDAFVNGQADTLREMMDIQDSMQLEAMLNAEQLASVTTRIREVTLETGISPEGRPCVLALYLLDDGYQAQMWYFKDPLGGSSFSSAPQPPNVVDRLSGNDMVESWFALLQEERDRGSEYDDMLDDLGQPAQSTSGSGGGTSGGNMVPPSRSPSSPGGPAAPRGPSGPRTPGGPRTP